MKFYHGSTYSIDMNIVKNLLTAFPAFAHYYFGAAMASCILHIPGSHHDSYRDHQCTIKSGCGADCRTHSAVFLIAHRCGPPSLWVAIAIAW
jgi:hypothetical protein